MLHPLRRAGLVWFLFSGVSGCSLDSEGIAEEFGAPDTGGELDTSSAEDSCVAVDSNIEPTDTGTPTDTSSPVDTATPDTGPFDTGTIDTMPETPVLTPSLTGEAANVADSDRINLATEGTLDWAHWGYTGATSWNRRNGATALIKGATTGAQQWAAMPLQFSWTGGTPTANATDTRTGIYQDDTGETLAFDAAGDPAVERTLRVYCTWNGSTGTVEARLSDATLTWSGTLGSGGGTGTIHAVRYQFKFKPATATGTLQVRITQSVNAGYIGLLAATLK